MKKSNFSRIKFVSSGASENAVMTYYLGLSPELGPGILKNNTCSTVAKMCLNLLVKFDKTPEHPGLSDLLCE